MWASTSLVLGLEASMWLFPLYNIWGLRPRASDLPRKHTLTYQTILQSFQKLQDHLWCINKSRHSIRCQVPLASLSLATWADCIETDAIGGLMTNKDGAWPGSGGGGAQLHQQGWVLPKVLMSKACFHDAIDVQQTRNTEILWGGCSLEKILQNHWN